LAYVQRDRLLANNALFQLQRGLPEMALKRLAQARQAGLDEQNYNRLLMRVNWARGDQAATLNAAAALRRGGSIRFQDGFFAARAALEIDNPGVLKTWLSMLAQLNETPLQAATLARGIVHAIDGRLDAAATELNAAQPEDPDLQFFHALWQARVLRQKGEVLGALSPLERARLLRPDSLAPLEEQTRCWRDVQMTNSFRFQMDEIRRLQGDPSSIVDEMAECRAWLHQAVKGNDPGPPPERLSLHLSELDELPSAEGLTALIAHLERLHQPETLIELGRSLEVSGRGDDALAAYQASQRLESSFAARWHGARVQRKLKTLKERSNSSREIAAESGFRGQWFSIGDIRHAASNTPFDGGIYRNGAIAITPRVNPGLQTIHIVASASTLQHVGAWAEVRYGSRIHRFYLDSRVPQVIETDIFATPGERQYLSIHFVNDQRDDAMGEDRNLFIYGIGVGAFERC